jgi:hypothetical protein
MMEAGTDPPSAEPDEPPGRRDAVRTLLRLVLRDPGHLPENLATFSVHVLGPGVPAYVAELRRQNPDADVPELERLIAQRGVRETSRDGGFVGPFLYLVPVAFCAALLGQLKMLLRMAAVAGRDPRAPARAAEILVILGVYPDVDLAAAALRKLPSAPPPTAKRHFPGAAMAGVVLRMAKLLGLIAPAAVTPVSRLIHFGRWMLLGLAFAVGMVVPLIWLPYLYMSYYRGTLEFAERVSLYYTGPARALHLPRKYSDIPGLASAAVRAAVSLVLTVGCIVLLHAFGVRVAGQEWPALLLLLVGLSSITGLVWSARRARRRHQAERSHEQARTDSGPPKPL